MRGHYKSERNEETGTSRPGALRPGSTYNVVLAVFTNDRLDAAVTLAQVFWLRESGGGPPERAYLVAERALCAAADFTGFGDDVPAPSTTSSAPTCSSRSTPRSGCGGSSATAQLEALERLLADCRVQDEQSAAAARLDQEKGALPYAVARRKGRPAPRPCSRSAGGWTGSTTTACGSTRRCSGSANGSRSSSSSGPAPAATGSLGVKRTVR